MNSAKFSIFYRFSVNSICKVLQLLGDFSTDPVPGFALDLTGGLPSRRPPWAIHTPPPKKDKFLDAATVLYTTFHINNLQAINQPTSLDLRCFLDRRSPIVYKQKNNEVAYSRKCCQ